MRLRSYLIEAQVGPLSFGARDVIRAKHDPMGLGAVGPFQVVRIRGDKVYLRGGFILTWDSERETYAIRKGKHEWVALPSSLVIGVSSF